MAKREKKYTLEEAKAIFIDQACAAEGHQWAVGSGANGLPNTVFCARGCSQDAGKITFPHPQPKE